MILKTKHDPYRTSALTGRSDSSGNIFAMLFAAVALTGVLASVGMQTLTGPVTTITRVTQRNVAENNLLMNTKILVNAAVAGINGGDADSDGIIEPAPFAAAGGGETPPVNGGYLPTALGLALTDPWGSKYGYCVWDHGTTNASVGRITGDNTGTASTQPVIAVIAAGPDKVFQTSCSVYSGSQVNVTKTGGSDDIIFKYTYAEATASSNGLWTLNSGNQAKAELKNSSGTANVTIDRDTGIGDFLGIITSTIEAKVGELISLGGALKLDTAGTTVDTCSATEKGAARLNASETALELCDGAGAWVPVGVSNATYITQIPNAYLTNEQALSALGTGIMKVTTGTGVVSSGAVDLSGSEATGILAAARFPALTGEVTTTAGSLATTVADDVLDFSEFKDAMSLDASTDVAVTGVNAFSITNTGTGASLTVNDVASDASPFVIDANGSVGIGVSSPAFPLQVAGDIRSTANAGSYRTWGLPDSSNTTLVLQGGAASGYGANIELERGGSALYDSALHVFRTLNGATERMRVDTATGNVGIGTASPSALLDVAGGIRLALHTTCAVGGGNNGTIQYDNTIKKMQVCVDGAWSNMGTIAKLDDVGDVDAATPNNNEVVAWDTASSTWKAKNIGVLGQATAAPGGSDKQIQFNDGGSLAGAAQLFWDKTNSHVGIGTATPSTSLHIAAGSDAATTVGGVGFIMLGSAAAANVVFDDNEIQARTGTAGSNLSLQYDAGDLNLVNGGGSLNVGAGKLFVAPSTNKTVAVGTTSPAASAAFDITSTTQGFLPPRMTTAQRDAIASPATGLVIFNTTTNSLEVRDSTAWIALGAGGGGGTTLPDCADGETIVRQSGAWVCSDMPDVFAFTDLAGQPLNTLVVSNILPVTGALQANVTITGVGSPQFRICSDASCTSVIRNWTNAPTTINQGQHLQLRMTSAAMTDGSARTATVQIGQISDAWSVSTQDDTPAPFSFIDVTNQPAATLITSNTLIISSIGPNPTNVSVTGTGSPQISINGGAWTTSGTILSGQTLAVRLTSASTSSTARTATVTVGNSSDTWSVATIPQDDTPNAFNFADVSDQPANTVVASPTLTITGIGPDPVSVSVTGAGSPQISINGGAWTTSGTILSGQTLGIRQTSASTSNTARTATVTVGTGSDVWSVTTATVTTGSQTYTSAGTYTFTVPHHHTLTVQVWGAGGGGAGCNSSGSTPIVGTGGGASSWNAAVIANGGAAANTSTGGAGGTASGGTTNSTGTAGLSSGSSGAAGGAAAGGASRSTNGNGNAGGSPGGGGAGARRNTSSCYGEGAGGGGYSTRAYTLGTYTQGSGVTVVVGNGGAGGNGSTYDGGAGGVGQVTVTWN